MVQGLNRSKPINLLNTAT